MVDAHDRAAERSGAASWILAIDASTPASVIAIGWVEDDRDALVFGDASEDAPNQASATLTGRIASALAAAEVSAMQLAAVACGRGPGTFTGTRVAVATTMGIALGIGKPAIAVSTLAAVAASVGNERDVLALLDARRGEVYGARYVVDRDPPAVQRIGEEQCVAIDALLETTGTDLVATGPGVAPYEDHLRARGIPTVPSIGPSPAGLWIATVAAWRSGAADDPATLRAVYLRESYAEMGVSAPKRPFIKSPFV